MAHTTCACWHWKKNHSDKFEVGQIEADLLDFESHHHELKHFFFFTHTTRVTMLLSQRLHNVKDCTMDCSVEQLLWSHFQGLSLSVSVGCLQGQSLENTQGSLHLMFLIFDLFIHSHLLQKAQKTTVKKHVSKHLSSRCFKAWRKN